MNGTGTATAFFKDGGGGYKTSEWRMKCPVEMSEWIFRMSVEERSLIPVKACPVGIQEFFIDKLWNNIIVSRKLLGKLAAMRFSYMGYSYWAAMSTVFFEYAVTSGLTCMPESFTGKTLSGYFIKEHDVL